MYKAFFNKSYCINKVRVKCIRSFNKQTVQVKLMNSLYIQITITKFYVNKTDMSKCILYWAKISNLPLKVSFPNLTSSSSVVVSTVH